MEEFKTVRVCGTEEEAAVIRGFLASEGIDVKLHSTLFKQEPVTFGAIGDVRVGVAPSDYDRAVELLENADSTAAETADDEDDSDSDPDSV